MNFINFRSYGLWNSYTDFQLYFDYADTNNIEVRVLEK